MDALLATLVLCCAALIAGTEACGDREFACRSPRRSTGCIPWSWVCDGDHHDCYDDSDEKNCTKSHCSDDQFACRSPRYPTTNCIPKTWVCDGDSKDCYDNSDETHCATQQQHCGVNEFKCRSRRRENGCIPNTWVCDGDHTDCFDDSDERNCATQQQHCEVNEFKCRSRRRENGCIPKSFVCDGDHSDCFDDSDELNCFTSTTTTTTTTSTTTIAPTTTTIAPITTDYTEITSTVSDETTEILGETSSDAMDITTEEKVPQLEESSITSTPAPTLKTTVTSTTAPTLTTTGEAQPCPERWFACASGPCVPPTMVCDGLSQCPDGTDERQCGERGVVSRESVGDAVRLELPSWLATDQDAHFVLSLAPMLRARAPRDKLDAQMAVLRLFRELARN